MPLRRCLAAPKDLMSRRSLAAGLLAVALAGSLAFWPATTQQAVNYEVKEYRIPLGVKTSEFLLRDYWYRRLSDEITQGVTGEEVRLKTLLAWTREHIRRIPAGWPVVDDHILHIIIRGYGEEEQQADVFTTLSAYAGIPAFWGVVKPGTGGGERLILSFARLDGRWTVWDVARGISFRRADGSLASVLEISSDSRLVESNAGGLQHQGHPYSQYLLRGLPHFFVPPILRAQKQMSWPRLSFEVQRLWDRFLSRWPCYNTDDLDPKVVFGE